MADERGDALRHGLFVIWPPDEVREAVNRLRERHDPVSAAICDAHITLTQPFLRVPSERDWATIAAIVAGFQPIRLSYGGIGTFLPYPCVYVAVEPSEPLTALHRALQAGGLFHPVPAHHERYVPHMTVMEGALDPEGTARLAEELRGAAPAGSFVCREIAWIVPDERFHFSTARTLLLGAGC
jgi:2'-5' RNA ligase